MTRSSIYMICLLLSAIFTPCCAIAADSHVRVEQNHLINKSGHTVVLRGFGLGGWLMPEGYMLDLPAPYDSPRGIRNAIIDLTDTETAELFFNKYEKNYVTENEIQAIASWGFNSLRVPFNANRLMPRAKQNPNGTYYFDASGLALIDNIVKWASNNKLYVILDMHAAPGGQSKHNIADSDGTDKLWQEAETYWPQTIALWVMLAERYKSNPWVIGYDLLNEPMLPGSEELGEKKQHQHDNTPLRAFYLELTKALRNIDHGKKILFVQGGFWAQNMKDLLPAWDDNLVYTYHAYPAPTSIDTFPDSVKAVMQAGHPVWFGEGGENWNDLAWSDWLKFNTEFITLMETELVGWNWWTTKKINRTTQPWQCLQPEGFAAIKAYLNKRGPKPSPKLSKQILLKLADNLRHEKCIFLPELVESLGGKPLSSRAK